MNVIQEQGSQYSTPARAYRTLVIAHPGMSTISRIHQSNTMLGRTVWTATRSTRRKEQLCANMWRQMQWLSQIREAHYAAIVAGAGPAGLAVVGNLLEQNPKNRVLWVDPEFAGGRLNKQWREVPSNTKVSMFTEYGKALEPFRKIVDQEKGTNAFSTLEALPQDKGCSIAHAADLVLMLSNGVRQMPGLDTTKGRVSGGNFDETSQAWTVELEPGGDSPLHTVSSSRLILATGSRPSGAPIPVPGLSIQRVTLDVALKPSQLTTSLPQGAIVAVIGASHSAILVLMNLYKLASTSHPDLRVKWFTRNPLKYAEYRDGWIKRDNTGLKGVAADWARTQLEVTELQTSEAGKHITKIECSGGYAKEKAQYEAHLPSCSHVVQATGFTRDPLPMLSRDGVALEGLKYDHDTGGFADKGGSAVPGLFGAGIAFPERVKNPEGDIELNVGMFKFMKFLKRVTGTWTGNGHAQPRVA